MRVAAALVIRLAIATGSSAAMPVFQATWAARVDGWHRLHVRSILSPPTLWLPTRSRRAKPSSNLRHRQRTMICAVLQLNRCLQAPHCERAGLRACELTSLGGTMLDGSNRQSLFHLVGRSLDRTVQQRTTMWSHPPFLTIGAEHDGHRRMCAAAAAAKNKRVCSA